MIPFYNSVNGGPPEPITALSPIAWYRYGVGITEAATLVSAWADQSGNGNDLVQGTGTNQPTLQSDNSILFDGVDNYMQTGAFTLSAPATFYLLMNQVSWASADRFIDGLSGSAFVGQNLVATPQIRCAGSSGIDGSTNLTLAVGSYGVVTVVFDGASSLLKVNNQTAVTGDTGTMASGGITLGANRSLASNFANISVKEAVFFPVAHDATTRATVITYLATVGGVNL